MDNNYSVLNNYLVGFFNSILRIEENSLNNICNDLSLSEMHTIEAIINSTDNKPSSVAAQLNVTRGTLSVALNTLEKKGYIAREKSLADRRQVKITASEKAYAINKQHQEFHREMVDEFIASLSAQELEIIMSCFEKLEKHFSELATAKANKS